MAGKFEISKTAENQYSFTFLDGDKALAASPAFDSLDACKRAVKGAKKNAGIKVENRFDAAAEEKTLPKYVLEPAGNQAKFTLYLQNGTVVLTAQAPSEAAALELIEKLTPEVFAEIKKDDKIMCANVDLYSGLVYKTLGIPQDLYTPLFATARMVGWCAHRIEELTSGGKIMRPAYKSVAPQRKYVPLMDRVEE